MTKASQVLSARPGLQARADAARRDRRSRWLRRATWTAGVMVPLALLVWLLAISSLLGVQHLRISGEHRLTEAQIRSAVDVSAGTPLARIDTGAIERRIRDLNAVASVDVSRSWPHTLSVLVVERVPVLALQDGSQWKLVDGTGVAFAEQAQVPKGVVRLSAGLTDTAARDAAVAVLHSLPVALRTRVGLIRATSAETVVLVLKDNRVIVWGSATDAKEKGEAALALLRMPGHLFDVSSPGVVTRK